MEVSIEQDLIQMPELEWCAIHHHATAVSVHWFDQGWLFANDFMPGGAAV